MPSIYNFRMLTRRGIIEKLEEYTLDELAEKYSTSKTQIQKQVQFMLPTVKGCGRIDEIDGIYIFSTVGAWTESVEKKYFDFIVSQYGNRVSKLKTDK